MAIFRVPIELTWPGPGSPGVNVFHVRTGVGADEADDLQSMTDALHTFYNALANMFATGTTVELGDVVNLETRAFAAPTFTKITATTAGAVLAPALQIAIAWRTSLAARRGMGRTFIGPLSTLVADTDGTPTASALNVVQTAANDLVTTSTAALNGAIAVYGYEDAPPADGSPRLPGGARVARDIVSARVRDQFAVLRSRRD